jgi:ribosomal protein S24E
MDGKTYSKEDIREMLAMALDQNITLECLIEEFLRTEEGEYQIPGDISFICSMEK